MMKCILTIVIASIIALNGIEMYDETDVVTNIENEISNIKENVEVVQRTNEIKHITGENFEKEVLNSDVPVLLDFWAAWCGPCNRLTPVLEKIASENSDIKIAKADIDNENVKELKEKYEIKNEDINEVRKIIALRYGIEKEGYSSMSAYIISNNISKASVAIFEEQSSKFPGIATSTTPRRKYLRGNLASHILGYILPCLFILHILFLFLSIGFSFKRNY